MFKSKEINPQTIINVAYEIFERRFSHCESDLIVLDLLENNFSFDGKDYMPLFFNLHNGFDRYPTNSEIQAAKAAWLNQRNLEREISKIDD